MPISSQWPSVVSLPLERSISRPATAGAPVMGGQPSSGSTLPRPSASRLGKSRPPTARATLPSVSDPSSPNSAASGKAPAPTASSTITHARGMHLFYGAVHTILGVVGLALFIILVIAGAAAVTALVVRISPTQDKPK